MLVQTCLHLNTYVAYVYNTPCLSIPPDIDSDDGIDPEPKSKTKSSQNGKMFVCFSS